MAALRTTLQRLRPGSSPLPQSFANRAYQPALRPFITTPRTLNSNTEDDIPNINITNYYTLFPSTLPNGPPPATKFDIPLRTLRAEFLSLQNRTHPDKFPPGAPKQKAEALSALLNEAYRTLSDPLTRAQYLLRIQHGIDVTAEESAATDKQALDPETLMAVMEVQEKIEELAEEEGSGEEAQKVIEDMKGENRERVEEGVKVLGEMVEKGDVEGMRRECVRLRFWYSVGEGLKEWTPGVREIRLVH
ncbi:J-type chaperone JAC1 [Aspergillus chevalieri]|uniref:J domain-containing protein n=1 Tax=Aspergillus chevalieri TaxID=182096 RepID=A0A7R7ZRW2_ASPCH|nr:uncharacterized protein ACHE_60653A [Aspergillus chevalieri]BCR90767.1 hypothetical protein ACHE_60653A [Aspergillus chevalieri]